MSEPSPSETAGAIAGQPHNYRIVGIVLAIGSGVLIGASFVFKKKGLIASQRGGPAGVGVAYLKSPLWWLGMTMMIVGELCNFGAYAFTEAIIVTPLGALSVVICAILSSIFLNEKLSFFGWIGCFQCIVGSVIIALNGPREQSVSTIAEFKKLFLAPGFLSFGSVVIAVSLIIIFFVAPRYGTKHMIWNILICSLIGGLSVSCTQGLGSAIVTSVRGYNQFKNWFTYFLLAFVVVTLLTEIYFLNVALALFNTAMVTPTYYVIFTFCTLVTSTVLYQGFKTSATQIITVVLGFLVICSGITLLQMSKIDPQKLQKDHNLDRKSTLLFKVAQEEVGRTTVGDKEVEEEEPGVDALRGFNGLAGTLARARRRTTMLDPEGEHHNVFIPGLGRQSSTRRGVSNGSALNSPTSQNGPNLAEQGMLQHPSGHMLTKAKTAPAGDLRPLTSFWHRRTGSGPRKTKVTPEGSPAGPSMEALPMTSPRVDLLRSKSNASTVPRGPPTDGHSFAGESVAEEHDEASQETDLSVRALLKEQEQKKAQEARGIPHIRFSPEDEPPNRRKSPPTTPATIPFVSSPGGGATPAGEGRVGVGAGLGSTPERPRSPPLAEYFNTPPHLSPDADEDDSQGTLRPSRHSDSATTARPLSSIPTIFVEGETDRDHDAR